MQQALLCSAHQSCIHARAHAKNVPAARCSAAAAPWLQGELELMKEFGREGQEVVLSRLPYWML